MILDAKISVAVKDRFENYQIREFSLFELKYINSYFENISLDIIKNKEIRIKIKCNLCDKEHTYKYNINDFIRNGLIVGACDMIGTPIIYMGKSEKIENKVSKLNFINKSKYAIFW